MIPVVSIWKERQISQEPILLGKPVTDKNSRNIITAVLRGNLNLCNSDVLYMAVPVWLWIMQRASLCGKWVDDYNHGTGHGVGYLLNVHEGNNAFRYRILSGPGKNPVLEAGMITSDEPGYLSGRKVWNPS